MKRGPRNVARLADMRAMYLSGKSLAAVAWAHNITRQSVYGLFTSHGLPLRAKTTLPFIAFNGSKYTMRNTGYYGKTDGKRTLLRRDMWEFYKGQIPSGWDVHHQDGKREHNHISNFECLPKAQHTRLHSHGQNQHTKAARPGA